jgi:uncharacterized protein YdeI (YjbR/CyaY-like superfamily)
MPIYIKRALDNAKLMEKYRARPPYQKNDYLAWIARAKREATRDKRIIQMLAELKKGGIYMNMKWNGDDRNSTDK